MDSGRKEPNDVHMREDNDSDQDNSDELFVDKENEKKPIDTIPNLIRGVVPPKGRDISVRSALVLLNALFFS
jgi:hypothetical protein